MHVFVPAYAPRANFESTGHRVLHEFGGHVFGGETYERKAFIRCAINPRLLQWEEYCIRGHARFFS